MKDIEKIMKEYVEGFFIDKKMYLTLDGLLIIILFAIFTPFHIIFLKLKNIFKKYC